MQIKRVMIAAPKSGSGKTVVTCALLKALKDGGQQAASYKCGPDYIDPMFHEKVIGVPAKNLDTFFTGEEETRMLFLNSAGDKDFAVLEGVMGLYDGLGGVREEGSSYHLARVTKTPVVLVVDAKGMGRSVISLLAGFLAYDRAHLIRGVILNRITKGYYETIKPFIEEELKLTVVGFLPDKEALRIESRHLGLVMPDEAEDTKEKLQAAAEVFLQTVSMERIMTIAESAEEPESDEAGGLEEPESAEAGGVEEPGTADAGGTEEESVKAAGVGTIAAGQRPVIAVAKDEAFCFYYTDNIRMLEKYGAEIAYFSPLHDEKLPDNCHALLFGGGYPELYAGMLSANSRMRAAVKLAAQSGMPIVAECGGFMYLHAAMTDREGVSHDMAGVVPATCFYAGKPVRFGYIELREKQSRFLPEGGRIKGHEFHYYDSTYNGTDATARKPVSGKEYDCIIEDERRFMGFPHLYYPSNPAFAKAFVAKAGAYQKERT